MISFFDSGVIRQGDGRNTYGNFARNTVVAVNLTSNRSVVGVGLLARSSEDLFQARNAGVCVKMLHVFGDKLWNLEPSHVLQIPNAGATVKVPKLNEFPELGESMSKPKKNSPKEQPQKTESVVEANTDDLAKLETDLNNVEISNENGVTESATTATDSSPDEKLKSAFLMAVKKMGKNPQTPLLTSNFYRCHILTVDDSIDIKHTSYKKLSKFLHEMAANDYLTVKEEPKGVEKITAFNTQHPDIANLILRVETHQQPTEGGEATADSLFVTEMKELYIVTEDTMKFFNTFDVKCGEGIEPAQVKKYVKDYVCNKKLQDPANIRTIHVDEMIRETCELNDDVKVIGFDQLLSLITEKMEHSYAMRNKNELKTSGKTATIKMTLATRSGNKKVTLIDHLEMFGIRLPEFAQACKIGVAASTSIIRPDCPGNSNKGQLLVQGNQVRFVYKLLTETYKIPPKYINGLDLAKKDKKPKKK